MSRLLSANFMRLKKDKGFWLCISCVFVLSVYVILNNYLNMKEEGTTIYLDNLFFGYALLIGIPIAIFCGLFLGTEYSDGTMRNKVVVGHERHTIYLANLIVCVSASFLMVAAYLIPALALGVPLLGWFTSSIHTVLLVFFGSLFMIIALAAIFTLLCMLNQNKAVAAVAAVVGIFLLIFAAIYLASALDAPETYQDYELNASGQVQQSSEIPNPDYLSGTKRTIYETLLNILPTGQGLQYASMSAVHLWRMPLYSLAILIITTGIGVILFRKKDIR